MSHEKLNEEFTLQTFISSFIQFNSIIHIKTTENKPVLPDRTATTILILNRAEVILLHPDSRKQYSTWLSTIVPIPRARPPTSLFYLSE